MRKALAAGGGMGAPSTKIGGDALQAESVKPRMENAANFKGDEKRRIKIQERKKREQKQDIWNNFTKKSEVLDFVKSEYSDLDKNQKKQVAMELAYKITKKQEEKLEELVKAKIDNIKYPKGSKGAAKNKKTDRKERNKDFKPKTKERTVEQRTKRALIDEPKASEENLTRIKNKQPKQPKKEDLEYPMAASEKMENDLGKK